MQFSTEEQTILNGSLLARSPYYQEWRNAVQKVFDAAEEHFAGENKAKAAGYRFILLAILQKLPLQATTVWQQWQSVGHALKLDTTETHASQSLAQAVLGVTSGEHGPILLDAVAR